MKRLLGGKKRKGGFIALLGLGATVAYARHRTGPNHVSYWNTHNRPT
jgi:hypothetical protein